MCIFNVITLSHKFQYVSSFWGWNKQAKLGSVCKLHMWRLQMQRTRTRLLNIGWRFVLAMFAIWCWCKCVKVNITVLAIFINFIVKHPMSCRIWFESLNSILNYFCPAMVTQWVKAADIAYDVMQSIAKLFQILQFFSWTFVFQTVLIKQSPQWFWIRSKSDSL
jgi:hypothetical protein